MCAQKDGECVKGTRVIKKKPFSPSLRRRNELTKMPRLKTRCGLDNAIQLSMRRSPDTDVEPQIKCSGPASGTHRRTRRRAPGAAAWEEFREISSPHSFISRLSNEESLAKGGISAKGESYNMWLALKGGFGKKCCSQKRTRSAVMNTSGCFIDTLFVKVWRVRNFKSVSICEAARATVQIM